MIKRADISADGLYRYRLVRIWNDSIAGNLMNFVMLNPSTADAEQDDPTIRRCIGFAKQEGMGGVVVVNIFALRSTNPQALRYANDPFGPGNMGALDRVAEHSKSCGVPVVCAWGTGGVLHNGDKATINQLERGGAKLFCLGKTKDGHPRHPLYVAGAKRLEAFP